MYTNDLSIRSFDDFLMVDGATSFLTFRGSAMISNGEAARYDGSVEVQHLAGNGHRSTTRHTHDVDIS